jgi:hypothetical protein
MDAWLLDDRGDHQEDQLDYQSRFGDGKNLIHQAVLLYCERTTRRSIMQRDIPHGPAQSHRVDRTAPLLRVVAAHRDARGRVHGSLPKLLSPSQERTVREAWAAGATRDQAAWAAGVPPARIRRRLDDQLRDLPRRGRGFPGRPRFAPVTESEIAERAAALRRGEPLDRWPTRNDLWPTRDDDLEHDRIKGHAAAESCRNAARRSPRDRHPGGEQRPFRNREPL